MKRLALCFLFFWFALTLEVRSAIPDIQFDLLPENSTNSCFAQIERKEQLSPWCRDYSNFSRHDITSPDSNIGEKLAKLNFLGAKHNVPSNDEALVDATLNIAQVAIIRDRLRAAKVVAEHLPVQLKPESRRELLLTIQVIALKASFGELENVEQEQWAVQQLLDNYFQEAKPYKSSDGHLIAASNFAYSFLAQGNPDQGFRLLEACVAQTLQPKIAPAIGLCFAQVFERGGISDPIIKKSAHMLEGLVCLCGNEEACLAFSPIFSKYSR